MQFKSFFVERAYFSELLKNSIKIINVLERKLKALKTILPRTKINALGYDFIFYKGKRKPEFAEYNAKQDVINVYVTSFYGDVDNFNFLKSGIPDKLKSILIHELSHANEEANNFLGYGIRKNYTAYAKDYYNSNTEINSMIVEKIYYYLDDYIIKMAKYQNFNDAFRILSNRILKDAAVMQLEPDKRQKYLKDVYLVFQNLIRK